MGKHDGIGSERRAAGRRRAALLAVALTVSLLGSAPAGQPAAAQENLPAACPPGEVPPQGFPDVDPGSVHAHSIACLAWDRHGVVRGRADGTYRPADHLRRDQMAGFIARVLQAAGVELPQQPDSAFADIAGSVFSNEINQLAEAGIVRGRTPDSYAPAEPVTRAQMASFLVRAYWEATAATIIDRGTAFVDVAGSVHEDNINHAAAAGFTAGRTATTYEPQGLVRRDQMASFLARLLDRLLTEGVLSNPRVSSEGFVFLDGEYVPLPYTIDTDGFHARINGRVALTRGIPGAPPAPDPPPQEPRDVYDLIEIASARFHELGGPGPLPPDEAVAQELVDLLWSYPVTAAVEMEPGILTVHDRDGRQSALLLAAHPATPYQIRTDLQRAALRWAELLAEGGVLLTTSGASVLIPGSKAAGFLHDLLDIYELPAEERSEAMEERVGPGVAPSLLAAGSPRQAIGDRLPDRTETASASEDVDSDVGLQSHGPQSGNRTPSSAEAWTFTPVTAEGIVCGSAAVQAAARLHGYEVFDFDGHASTMHAVASSSGRAGIFYGCAHGGDAYEMWTSRDIRDASWNIYQQSGYSGLRRGAYGGRFYIVGEPEFFQSWQSANSIVLLDSCMGWNMREDYGARDFIGSRGYCAPGRNVALHSGFWERLAGTRDQGRRREVRDAFNASYAGSGPVFVMEDRMWGDAGGGGIFLHHSPEANGRTVLSPSVARQQTTPAAPEVGASVRGFVRFDAGMGWQTEHALHISGPCAGEAAGRVEPPHVQLLGDDWLDFEVEARAPGPLIFRISWGWAWSADEPSIFLDGNQDPPGTDHVGPNRDDYVWEIQCVGEVEEDPRTPPDDDEYALDVRMVGSDGRVIPSQEIETLVLDGEHYPKNQFTVAGPEAGCDADHYHSAGEARSLEGGTAVDPDPGGCGYGRVGEVPEVVVTVPDIEPAKGAYVAGERVSVTVPAWFTAGGYEHFFGLWTIEPDLPHEVDGTTLWITMDADVTATAFYESAPVD